MMVDRRFRFHSSFCLHKCLKCAACTAGAGGVPGEASMQWEGSANALGYTGAWHVGGLARRPTSLERVSNGDWIGVDFFCHFLSGSHGKGFSKGYNMTGHHLPPGILWPLSGG